MRNINAYEHGGEFLDSLFVFNRNGKVLFTSTVDSFSKIFSNGLALSSSGDHDPINYINHFGEVVIRTQFIHGQNFKNGYAILWSDSSSILIDSTGKTIREFGESLINSPSDGLICVNPDNNDTTYYYNMQNVREGKPLLSLNSQDKYYASFINGYAHVFNRLNNNHGFINKRGELVIDDKYEAVKDFYGGLAAVKNEKWGFIDQKGSVIIPFVFDYVVVDFTTPLAMVRNGNDIFWINKRGEKISPVR